MTRKTSIEAYNKIRNEGLLSQKRWEIYDVLYRMGPMTSGEVFKLINANHPIRNLTQSRARFTELRQMGCIDELGERPCTATGYMAILWDVNSRIPVKLKRPTRKDDLKSAYDKISLVKDSFNPALYQYIIKYLNESMELISRWMK